MATIAAGTPLASAIQSASQAKLIENGWVAEENDTTLSEYVTMMVVNGKDPSGVQAELGGELLGIGEDDPGVVAFAQWLFAEVGRLSAVGENAPAQSNGGGEDEAMGDAAPVVAGVEGVYVHPSPRDDPTHADATTTRPSGPKAMRQPNPLSTRGSRGGRNLLGQLNRNMDRSSPSDVPDALRRIKGAARVNTSHANSPRGGPRGGLQRMLNGRGGGSNGNSALPTQAQQAGAMNQLDPQNQMLFMQMMEMQANMMASMVQAQSQPGTPNHPNPSFHNSRGRGGAGRGGLFDRITPASPLDSALPSSSTPRAPNPTLFNTPCKFNHLCTAPTCGFAHQSPANTRPGLTLDMSDTCSHGIACMNSKCSARHPSPALRNNNNNTNHNSANGNGGGARINQPCKFFPSCTAGPACPFRHPETPPCRNGADCALPGCSFAHSTIVCRYNPCTRPDCVFKHAEGQRKGRFADKVWTPAAANGNGAGEEEGPEGKYGRFASLVGTEGEGEELILPGKASADGMEVETAEATDAVT